MKHYLPIISTFLALSACVADEAPPQDTDTADQGTPGQLKVTCVASRNIITGPMNDPTPMELEVNVTNKGTEFERTEFRVKDTEKFPYKLAADTRADSPDIVHIDFSDMNTKVGHGVTARFGHEADSDSGDRIDWNLSQVKGAGEEFLFMSCCRNDTGRCAIGE